MSRGFILGRTVSIARKEIRHLLRDRFTLGVALGLPMVLLAFFGYAIDFNVRDIHLVALDRDHTRASRQFLEVLTASQYFLLRPAPLAGNFMDELDAERTKGAILIEPGFGKAIGSGQPSQVQVLLDGADNSTAGIIMGYLTGIGQAAGIRLTGVTPAGPMAMKTRFLFNPELNSRWFVAPGLLAVIIGFLSILLTALTIAREWESGSMEMLLSTPVRPLEIIMGKLAPYLALSIASVVVVYLVARIGLGVPFKGNHVIFAVGCLLFILPSLAQGIVISVVTRQQQIAMQLSFLSGLLPPLLLSGFIFPIESMPLFFRILTAILAPRWFIEISRGVFLKNVGWAELTVPLLVLLALNVVLITAAVKLFKQDLER